MTVLSDNNNNSNNNNTIKIIRNNNFITYNAQIFTLDVHVCYQMRVKEKMNSKTKDKRYIDLARDKSEAPINKFIF